MKGFIQGIFVLISSLAVLAEEQPLLEIASHTNGIILQWAAKQPSGGEILLKYQVQQSPDLQAWSSYGPPIRSTATNQPFSRLVEKRSSRAFYRVTVNSESRTSALATGGENVFGYSDLLANALEEIGQISPEQFAERFSSKTDYLPSLTWDPTTAEFWPAFSVDPAVYNAELIPGVDDLRQFDFRLNAEE